MNLGQYTQRITFYTEGNDPDGYGGYTPTQSQSLTTWARIEQIARSKTLEQVQERLNSSYRVSIQSRKGFSVEETMLVEWKGTKFQIITGGYTKDVLANPETTFDICQS